MKNSEISRKLYYSSKRLRKICAAQRNIQQPPKWNQTSRGVGMLWLIMVVWHGELRESHLWLEFTGGLAASQPQKFHVASLAETHYLMYIRWWVDGYISLLGELANPISTVGSDSSPISLDFPSGCERLVVCLVIERQSRPPLNRPGRGGTGQAPCIWRFRIPTCQWHSFVNRDPRYFTTLLCVTCHSRVKAKFSLLLTLQLEHTYYLPVFLCELLAWKDVRWHRMTWVNTVIVILKSTWWTLGGYSRPQETYALFHWVRALVQLALSVR